MQLTKTFWVNCSMLVSSFRFVAEIRALIAHYDMATSTSSVLLTALQTLVKEPQN